MGALKNADRGVLIAVPGTLAVFGSFIMGAVFFSILLGLGMNEDLAWGLSVLMWLAVVAFGIPVRRMVLRHNQEPGRADHGDTDGECPAGPAKGTTGGRGVPHFAGPAIAARRSRHKVPLHVMEGDKEDGQSE